MPVPLSRPTRGRLSLLVLVALTTALVLVTTLTATAAPKAAKPHLELDVNYVRAHDGPIDCQRAPVLHTFVVAFLPKSVRSTAKRLTQLSADYRPRPGAVLTVGGQRFTLAYEKTYKSVRGRQVQWAFQPTPIDEAAGEAATKATIRYTTKRGPQKLKTVVFAEGCV